MGDGDVGPPVGALDGGPGAARDRRPGRHRWGRRPPESERPRSSSASTCSCSPTARGRPRTRRRRARGAREPVVSPLDSYVSARMIQLAVPVGGSGRRAADRRARRRARGRDAGDPRGLLPRRGRGRRPGAGARARVPLRARRAVAPQGDPGRPRRGVPERARDRAGGDRRDPRPPSHRLDRDARPGARRSIRSARRRRSCPSGSRPRGSSRAARRDDAARRPALGHRDLDLADHDGPRRPRRAPARDSSTSSRRPSG